MKIIGLAGRKWAGKDTAADYLVTRYGFVKYAFAGPLKSFCRDIFDLSEEQLYGPEREIVDERFNLTPRQLLQKFGSDFLRDMIDQNFWVNFFSRWAAKQIMPVVVSDVRFQNEVDVIKSLGGTVVKIVRKDDRCVSNDPHASEAIDELRGIDAIIENGDKTQFYKDLISVLDLDRSFR